MMDSLLIYVMIGVVFCLGVVAVGLSSARASAARVDGMKAARITE